MDFTATPDGVLRRTGCREPFARDKKKGSVSKSREKGREQTKGLKEKEKERLPGASENSPHKDYLYVLRYIPVHGVYCARGEINKHVKPRDSFTPDKNMLRDTYLDSLFPIFPLCASCRLPPPLSLSFAPQNAPDLLGREFDDCINYV